VCGCIYIYIYIYIYTRGPGSSVGIATDYGLDSPGSTDGIKSQLLSTHHCIT